MRGCIAIAVVLTFLCHPVVDAMGGMSFNTPMDRHQWLMQQLSQAAGQMDPASAQLVKSIIQKAGNADVKGGNC